MECIGVAGLESADLNWEKDLQVLQTVYRLQTVTVNLGHQNVELIKVANIDDLLDKVTDPDEIPFWADLWPASIGLGRFILGHPEIFKHKRILELGSGVGLAGIAAKLAAAEVVQSDFTEEALKFTRINCLKNQVTVGELFLADWRKFPMVAEPFDCIIGSDILYEKNLHPELATIIKQALKPNGLVFLADPGREYAKQFIQQQKEAGWSVEQILLPVFYNDHSYQIDIYRLEAAGN